MNNNKNIEAALQTHGENFHFEFKQARTDQWYRSLHLARPLQAAEALVQRLNSEDKTIVYRSVPWDGGMEERSDNDKRLIQSLNRDLGFFLTSDHCTPFLCFGELLAMNEGSAAFNHEMDRSGDKQRAHKVSEQTENHVMRLAAEVLKASSY